MMRRAFYSVDYGLFDDTEAPVLILIFFHISLSSLPLDGKSHEMKRSLQMTNTDIFDESR